MSLVLDHLAVAGETLEEATACIEEALGVRTVPGGQHVVFGTHNRLLGLADGLYLEAIAIDPEAAPVGPPRWFDLDRFRGPARLSNWICATDDLAGCLTGLGSEAGVPVALSRGALRWQMAVPDNGRLPFDNLHPALIEWESPVHPSANLPVSGCTLRRLVVTHPEAEALRGRLGGILSDTRLAIEPGEIGMRAEFDTPSGRRSLQ